MGGGDLNSKKSWHPNTMKNQVRVWKAEQAAAQEKKRIQELQREHAVERDRTELNSMIKQNIASGSGSSDNRLHWMYDKPDRKAHQEDYLLGKSIEKNYDNVEKQERDVIPAVARRVVGSSMLSTAGDSQVDLARKLREDPLLLVKERERAARAALLNNPLQRRRLTELLRKEQEQKRNHKSKKTKKKDKDLDKQLAAKLNALGGEKGLNLATLLASDNSDSDSSSEEEEKSKKKKHKRNKIKKQKKKKKNKKHSSSDDSSDNEKTRKQDTDDASQKVNYGKYRDSRKRKSEGESSDSERNKKSRYSSDKHSKADDRSRKSNNDSSKYNKEDNHRRQFSHRSEQNNKKDTSNESHGRNRGAGMSNSERAAALAAMAAAGAEREQQRGRRVAEQRAAEHAEHAAPIRPRAPQEARMLPDSLETRIHSNRHYIQRSHRHMDEHFARR